jgi:calcineurin-like phosphoesterase family protein
MIYFTSDCHFNAQRTIDISKRPFGSLEELNKTLILNWNKTVSKDDIVYILGDFGDLTYAKYLNGKKYFIKGNYERYHYSDKELKKYFDVVCPTDVMYIAVEYNNKLYHLQMTHEPLNLNKEPMTEDHIGLFGHVHKLCMVKKYGINVGSDLHYFTPISMDTILFYHNAALNYYDENVFY